MNPRLALLSAILANPDDDLPRLVFADWLEEHGTTDADAARVEFIRLGCKSKAKSRISVAEGMWLDRNWKRLLRRTRARRPKGTTRIEHVRRGRMFQVQFFYIIGSSADHYLRSLEFEFVRGFARRVRIEGAYEELWRAVSTDEPIALQCPGVLTNQHHRISGHLAYVTLDPERWGGEVYSRVEGYDEETGNLKVFRDVPKPDAVRVKMNPVALQMVGGLDDPLRREFVAVATAMTAIAREYVGLDSSL